MAINEFGCRLRYRQWDAAGYKFPVRADNRRVLYQGNIVRLSDVRDQLFEQGTCQAVGTVLYNKDRAYLEIAEAEVTLYRPA
jgi:hypothetical protein